MALVVDGGVLAVIVVVGGGVVAVAAVDAVDAVIAIAAIVSITAAFHKLAENNSHFSIVVPNWFWSP